MKALIWKELRENIGWALLAMIALGGSEFYALHHQQYPGQIDVYFNDGITLCKKPFLMVTMFGCAAAGLALGFLQVLPELKRDRWAALLHRPVSRGRFFWGKATAGVLLYLIAAGLPFLVTVWRVATPGNFATPFLPEMVRPGLADLATGLAYYFAALLVALQGGGVAWRALPLFAAVHVSFVAISENLFRVALVSALAMTLVLCLAGWGAIHARETLRGRPWLGRVAFLIVAFYGACGLGDLAKMLGAMAGSMGDRKFSAWDVLENGVPARIDYVNSVIVAVTDVEGKPFADPKYRSDRVRSYTLGMNVAGSYVGDSHGWRPKAYERDYRESSTYLYALQPYAYPRFEQWFHLYRSGFYVGMAPMEKKEFARFGMDGFAPPGTKIRGFSKDVDYSVVDNDTLAIATPESLRFARLPKRESTTIQLPAPGPIYGMCHAWARTPTGSADFQGVALGTGMAVVNGRGSTVAMLPYHHDVDRWGRLSLGVTKTMDQFILQSEPSDWIDRNIRKSMPWYVENMDAQGKVLASFELPPLPPSVNPPTWSNFLADHVKSPVFFFGEMLYRRIGAALGSSRLREALAAQLGRDSKSTFQTGRSAVLVALLCSAITFTWARRGLLPTRRAAAWAAGTLVLGLPGLILFWLVGERPRTVPCPACRRLRRIDGEACLHCGSPWPEHPADETRIFDRTPASSPAV